MLLIQQAYLVKKLKSSSLDFSSLTDLHVVQARIRDWYVQQSEKIKDQSRREEFQSSEHTRIYHHDLHKKSMNKGSILKLETESGLLEGHDECSDYLEEKVRDLIGNPAHLDIATQEVLLAEVEPVYSEADNIMLEATPSEEEILATLNQSNLRASPGTDGI